MQLPEKQYFRIGEVARILDVATHVIRFWETEFRAVRPQKSASGQRVYSRRDVERLATIKRLLKEERYTIEGARRMLRERLDAADVADEGDVGARRAEALREGLLAARARLLDALEKLGSAEG